MDQQKPARILLGRRDNQNEFVAHIDRETYFACFSRGNYEEGCEKAAEDLAKYLGKKQLSEYIIMNGRRLVRGKIRTCNKMLDNGEFAFIKTLELHLRKSLERKTR